MAHSFVNTLRAGSLGVRALAGTALVALATLALSPAVTSAAPAFVFNIFLGSTCVAGTGPANATLTVTLKNRDDVVVDTKAATTNSSGAISMTPCFKRAIRGLDRIRASDGSVARQIIIPNLTIATNRVTDVVSGHAPAGSNVTFTGCHYREFLHCTSISGSANAAANGGYTRDFSHAVNLRGGDWLQVSWSAPAGDVVVREGYVPNSVVSVGDSSVRGYANAGQSVAVKLIRSGSVRATGADVADAGSGSWSATMRRSSGTAIVARAGDVIRGTWAPDGALTVPSTSVTGNAATDHISGHCLAGSPVQVLAQRPDFSASSWASGRANQSGNFNVDMSDMENPTFDLHHGDNIEVSCLTSRGDTIMFRGKVP